ncbi:hypothetical protein EZS27_012343 [termite gut metagenome]|uniref:ORC1/DEAH AAA+ ATPase domain-containing protein n=1 Tax=termite gut metagenome TaxID=433724 RepID=A0A5J4S2L6_9ZZZZ
MTLEEKKEIAKDLLAYCDKYESRNVASRTLKKISPSTISTIANGNFEKISDDMFTNIRWQVSIKSGEWNIQETDGMKDMFYALGDAQENRNVTWVTGSAGCGKTMANRAYMMEHKEVYYILCSNDMNKFDFVRELARVIGISSDKNSIREAMDSIIRALGCKESPLLIFDEGDKLSDAILFYFITIYNRLEDKVGIVFTSTDNIKRRMSLGLHYNKQGYQEIYSRIGRKFIDLRLTTNADVYGICAANGIETKADLKEVLKEAEAGDYDLRVVKKAIHKRKIINELQSRPKDGQDEREQVQG